MNTRKCHVNYNGSKSDKNYTAQKLTTPCLPRVTACFIFLFSLFSLFAFLLRRGVRSIGWFGLLGSTVSLDRCPSVILTSSIHIRHCTALENKKSRTSRTEVRERKKEKELQSVSIEEGENIHEVSILYSLFASSVSLPLSSRSPTLDMS